MSNKNYYSTERARLIFHFSAGIAIATIYGLTSITKWWATFIMGIVGIAFIRRRHFTSEKGKNK